MSHDEPDNEFDDCDCPGCKAAADGKIPGYIHCKDCTMVGRESGVHEVLINNNTLTIYCNSCKKVVGSFKIQSH